MRVRLAAGLATLLTISVLLSSCHSSGVENRTLAINGAVHVYPNEVPPAVYPGPDFIEVLGPKDQVKVRQVVYKNGYMAVKVKLKDGREGWVFSGESIELK
jgi:hypothetical protein